MAILVSDNFNYKARKPLDNRIMQPDVATMAALKEATLYDGMLCYVQDTDKYYVFDSSNSMDPILAKFREFKVGSVIKAYKQDIEYDKDDLIYFDDKLARVLAYYKSDNTEADAEASFKKDIDDLNIILVSGESNQTIKPYMQDIQYYRNDLVFLGTSLARVVADYKSDNTAADNENSFKADIANGSLTLVSGSSDEFVIYETTEKLNREINKTTLLKFADFITVPGITINDLILESLVYSSDGTVGKITSIDTDNDEIEVTTISISDPNHYMKQAPDKREYTITNAGTNYTVGDTVETTELGKFVEVTQVNVNGEILEVIESLDETANTSGTNAIIDTKEILYVGNGNNWFQLPSIEFPRSEVFEYKQNDEYKINDIIIYNDNVYLALKNFTADNLEATVDDSFAKDVDLKNIVAVYTDTDTHSFAYTVGQKYKENNLIVKNRKLYMVTVDFTAADFDDELDNGQISPVDTDTHTYIYTIGDDYNESNLIIKDSKLYIVVKDFTAADFDQELDDGDLIPVGSNGTSLTAYKVDTKYEKDSLIYYGSTVARVVNDFTSTNDPSIDDAFETDVDNGDIIPIGGSGDASLVKNITANITVGNIKNGETIKKDTSFTEFVEKLLIAEINPTVAITTTPTTTNLRLKGTTVNVTNIRATLTTGSATIKTIEFYRGSTLLDTKNYVDGTNIYDLIITDAITTDTEYIVKVNYIKKDGVTNANITAKGKYEFVYNAYYGLIDPTVSIDDALIKGLSKTSLKKTKAFTVTYDNPGVVNKRILYAYPADQGTLSSIKDQNNFEYITGSYSNTQINIDGVSYQVYWLTLPVTATGLRQVYA